MARWFNVSGPCVEAHHFMVPVEHRLPAISRLVAQQAYFGVHAPRQVGKTTTILAAARALTTAGAHASAVLSMETGAPFPGQVGKAELAILDDWRDAALRQLPEACRPPPWPEAPEGRRLGAALAAWARTCPRPLVLFLDEIDALRDEVLLSVLRQLRSGFGGRPTDFPSSIGLVGMRDVRDYAVAAGASGHLGTASPFNVKDDSLTLPNFTPTEVGALLAQHTHDTGQPFTADAVSRIVDLTQGQPWLVNALAKRLVEELVPDRAVALGVEHVEQARAQLIARQDTHLDSLGERLRDPRVRQLLEPMLAGGFPGDVRDDDRRFVLELGLLRETAQGTLEVANPIYRDIIGRTLSAAPRAAMPALEPTWLGADGQLDPARLLSAFLSFWRQHADAMLGTAPYHEVAPHLVLMAFLHRVVNGGGTITREYAIGRGRMDLLVELKRQRLAVELKVWREGRKDPVPEGLEQLDGYLAGLGLATGWLVVFDRRDARGPVEDRTSTEEATTPSGRRVTVVRA